MPNVTLSVEAEVQAHAQARRAALWNAYKMAGRVSHLGVRVDCRGGGEVLQVGRESLASLVAHAAAREQRMSCMKDE